MCNIRVGIFGIAHSLPVFNYEITADVTDINGETRSATRIVNVGYHALTANMSIDGNLDKTKKNHAITIDTKNLNGAFVAAKGTIKIHKLKAPNAVIRPRPWAAPDYQDIYEADFKKLFPHDAYNAQQHSNNWKKGKLEFVSSFNTGHSTTLNLGKIKKWASGAYLITLESTDKFGQLVKDEIKTTLFSDTDDRPADNKLFSISTDKSEYQNGDTAHITLGSAAKNISVTVVVEKDKKIIKTEIIRQQFWNKKL